MTTQPNSPSMKKLSNKFEVVNIVKTLPHQSTKKIQLDEDALKDILLQPDVAGYPVALYSIAGPFRSGKSFLLNLFVRHIQEKIEHLNENNSIKIEDTLLKESDEEEHHSLLDNEQKTSDTIEFEQDSSNSEDLMESLESWFGWRGGLEHHTEGIHVLKHPFIFPSNSHGKVAVFLMDTQGMFDHSASTKISAEIGAFSFLISSCQMFNVRSQIDGQHLQYIYRFTQFAKDIKNHDDERVSPFQSLMFLIRDWKMPSFEYGFNGGRKYIDYVMKPREYQAEEHRHIRNDMNETFDDITCILFPPPGDAVEMTEENVEGFAVKDIRDLFLDKTNELFEYLCSPETIILKKMGGEIITGKQLFYYMLEYSAIIESGLEENVEKVALAGFNVKAKSVMEKVSEEYKTNMSNQACKYWNDSEQMRAAHASLKNDALVKFDCELKMGEQDIIDKCRLELDTMICISFAEIKEFIQMVYATAIENYQAQVGSSIQLSGIEDLELRHQEAIKQFALNIQHHQLSSDLTNIFCQHFEKETDNIHKDVKTTAHRNRKFVGAVAGAAGGAALLGASLLFNPALVVAHAIHVSSPVIVGTGAAVFGKIGSEISSKLDKGISNDTNQNEEISEAEAELTKDDDNLLQKGDNEICSHLDTPDTAVKSSPEDITKIKEEEDFVEKASKSVMASACHLFQQACKAAEKIKESSTSLTSKGVEILESIDKALDLPPCSDGTTDISMPDHQINNTGNLVTLKQKEDENLKVTETEPCSSHIHEQGPECSMPDHQINKTGKLVTLKQKEDENVEVTETEPCSSHIDEQDHECSSVTMLDSAESSSRSKDASEEDENQTLLQMGSYTNNLFRNIHTLIMGSPTQEQELFNVD